MSQSEPLLSQKLSPPKRASLFQIFKAMLWSMLGIRQLKGYENDTANITPMQAVLAALVGLVMFVVTVMTLVHFAIKYLS